jgi:hypothetical protein
MMSSHDEQLRAENQRQIDAIQDREPWNLPAHGTASQDYAYDDGNQEDEASYLGSHLKQ